jgi:hypothetical protein
LRRRVRCRRSIQQARRRAGLFVDFAAHNPVKSAAPLQPSHHPGDFRPQQLPAISDQYSIVRLWDKIKHIFAVAKYWLHTKEQCPFMRLAID